MHEFIDDHFTDIIHIYYSYFEKFINSACIRKKQGSKMVGDDSAVFAGANRKTKKKRTKRKKLREGKGVWGRKG